MTTTYAADNYNAAIAITREQYAGKAPEYGDEGVEVLTPGGGLLFRLDCDPTGNRMLLAYAEDVDGWNPIGAEHA